MLKGYRIVDLGQVIAGTIAGMIFADMGAEVIKVESPSGDIGRNPAIAGVGDVSSIFLTFNRGKKSVVLDLKTSEGKEVFLDLVAVSRRLRGRAIRPHSRLEARESRWQVVHDDGISVRTDAVGHIAAGQAQGASGHVLVDDGFLVTRGSGLPLQLRQAPRTGGPDQARLSPIGPVVPR